MRLFGINPSALACAAGMCVAAAAVAQNEANQPQGNQPAGNQPGAAQPAQVTDPARARLLEAQQAIKNTETLSYELQCTITMMMGGAMDVDAKVDMMRKEESRQWLVRRQGEANVPGMGKNEFTVVNDGGYVTYIDHDSKRVREEIARTTRKHRSLTLADSAWLETLTATEPYAELLAKGQAFSLEEGAERLDGVMCDRITVALGENRGEEIWWFGADDKLPRKHVMDVGGGMNRTFQISKVRTGHDLDESNFEIDTPDGYEFVTSRREQVEPGEFTQQQTRTPARPKAPDFTLTSADGKEVSLSGLQDRVVLLNFWASWSSASREALDDVQAIHEKYADQPVTVLSLPWRERSPDAAAEEINERGHTYTLLPGADDVAREFGARGFPTFYIIGKDGSIVETVTEYDPQTTRPALTGAIDRALAGESETTTVAPGNQSGDNSPAGNQPGNQPRGNQPGGNRPGGNQPGGGNGNG